MFSSVDKAIIALIMAALFLINNLWGEGWWSHLTEEVLAVILAVLTPIFVYMVPNSRTYFRT